MNSKEKHTRLIKISIGIKEKKWEMHLYYYEIFDNDCYEAISFFFLF